MIHRLTKRRMSTKRVASFQLALLDQFWRLGRKHLCLEKCLKLCIHQYSELREMYVLFGEKMTFLDLQLDAKSEEKCTSRV